VRAERRVNHRGLQRSLYRMQLDPGFAARLCARDAEAEASTGLGQAELAWLRAVDPAAISADRDGRRRAQLLRNVAGEFALSCAVAPTADWLDAFPASPQFHRAIAGDTSLALAFGDYARERAAGASESFASLVALECALARARRATRALPPLPAGTLALAPVAWLVELRDGVFAWATALRAALDRGKPAPRATLRGGEREIVLVAADPAPVATGRVRGVRAERLEPLVADFLAACEAGLPERERSAFASRRDVDPADVESVAREFLAEGVLVRA
jgi:hypothetical protein